MLATLINPLRGDDLANSHCRDCKDSQTCRACKLVQLLARLNSRAGTTDRLGSMVQASALTLWTWFKQSIGMQDCATRTALTVAKNALALQHL